MLKNLERVVTGFHSGQKSWLFTGVLPNGYGPPDSFCFDAFCDDQPIMVGIVFYTIILPLSHEFD